MSASALPFDILEWQNKPKTTTTTTKKRSYGLRCGTNLLVRHPTKLKLAEPAKPTACSTVYMCAYLFRVCGRLTVRPHSARNSHSAGVSIILIHTANCTLQAIVYTYINRQRYTRCMNVTMQFNFLLRAILTSYIIAQANEKRFNLIEIL